LFNSKKATLATITKQARKSLFFDSFSHKEEKWRTGVFIVLRLSSIEDIVYRKLAYVNK
jgi:hypothetical protein